MKTMKTIILIALISALTSTAMASTPFLKFASSVVKTTDSDKASALKAVFGGAK